MGYAGSYISQVKWKENPSIGNRIDVFVYAADTLPFGQGQQEFTVTIPDAKGKVVYFVGGDYDLIKIYDWQNDHIVLMSELQEVLFEHFPEWTKEKVMLMPVSGIRTVDGMEGIEYSVDYLTSEDGYYYQAGDKIISYGDMEMADFHIWISLAEPRQIRKYYHKTGEYEVVD